MSCDPGEEILVVIKVKDIKVNSHDLMKRVRVLKLKIKASNEEINSV